MQAWQAFEVMALITYSVALFTAFFLIMSPEPSVAMVMGISTVTAGWSLSIAWPVNRVIYQMSFGSPHTNGTTYAYSKKS